MTAVRRRTTIGLSLGLTMGLLSGCGFIPIPGIVSHASTALTGFSYITTGKGTMDHLVSELTGEDCVLLRGFTDDPMCQPNGTAIASAEPAAPSQASPTAPIGFVGAPAATDPAFGLPPSVAVSTVSLRKPPEAAAATSVRDIMRQHLQDFTAANGHKAGAWR